MDLENDDDFNSLWQIADLAFEEFKEEESKKRKEENKEKCINIECDHEFNYEFVCIKCGVCSNYLDMSLQALYSNWAFLESR